MVTINAMQLFDGAAQHGMGDSPRAELFASWISRNRELLDTSDLHLLLSIGQDILRAEQEYVWGKNPN
ncbi:hypothetical protein [Robbsia sp. KACC 23696]|uniref:hypothetical protein n=1 Tax=Robbsia sp. KACC 23696 TaxID=3149231 RepID=UPI00325A5E79